MNEFQIFNSDELEHIKTIEDTAKNSYMGFIYILDYGTNVKIGYSQKLSNRIKQLKRQAEYGNLKLGNIAISKPHTNYKENEKLLHQHFKQYRISRTELFSITLKQILSKLPDELKFLDESEKLTQESEQGFEKLKNTFMKLLGIETSKTETDCKFSVNINEKPLKSKNFCTTCRKGADKMNDSKERLKPLLIDYIQEVTQKSKGKDQYVCPFCNSGTGHNGTGAFTYYPDTRSYKCFACGEYGDIFTLYARLNNLSLDNDFTQIVGDLQKKFNLSSSQTSKPEPWLQLRTHVYQNMNHDKIATKTIYRKPDGSKTAIWHRYEGNTLVKGLNGLKMPLYHVYNLTDNTKPVFIVEGEKDVETMEKLGYIATTSPNGAGSHWHKEYTNHFRGFDVVILADNDEVGLKYATEIAENVIQIARSVKLVPSQALYVPLKPKGDISDIVECIGSAKATQLIEGVLNGNEYIFTPKPSSELQQDNSGRKKPDFNDFSLFDDFMLRHGYSIRYNQITHCYEFIGFGKQESPEHLAENVPTILYDQLRKEYSKVNLLSIMNYITLYATRNRYNPVLDMIKAEKWDGKDRVTEIYNIFRIPADDTLSRVLIYKWLMQDVCGLFNNIENPFSLDIVLVFQGNQGIGKTRFLEKLALHPKFFAEGCCIDPRNKDSIMLATNKWICELGEIGSTMKKDIDSVKAFLSRSTDEYRTPYGKAMLQYPRVTSFVGTVNDEQFLVDQTGNRRFATVPLPPDLEIDYETQIKPFNALQLWSQIYQIVKDLDKASCFRLTTEEKKLLDERNQHFMKPLRAEEEVLDILAEEQREETGYTCSVEPMTVTQFMQRHSSLSRYNAAEVGRILKKYGYDSKKKKLNGKSERVLELPVKRHNSVPKDFY